MNNNTKRLEEGGVFGVFGDNNAANACFYAMYSMQHRGQTSCGAVLSDNFNLSVVKGKGLVSDVIQPNLSTLKGDMGIAHLRYGDKEDAELYLQPMISNYFKGNICISIGGKITNSDELKAELEDGGAIFQLGSDAEILAHLFARERTKTNSIESAVLRVMAELEGAYAVLLMSSSKILAFRDRDGLRPLCIGKKDGSFYFASEDVAFTAVGAEKLRDVLPGELVLACNTSDTSFTDIANSKSESSAKKIWEFSDTTDNGLVSFTDYCGEAAKTCIYEYLYFARPDSEIDGVSVYEVRINAGRRLAETCPAAADLVVGVPSAGLHYAMGYALESGIPFGDGLIRNYYLGRISSRDNALKDNTLGIKLSVIKAAVRGKSVVLVDDSMIRGKTAKKLVKMLKDGGAREVHLRIACPRFTAVCPFSAGIVSDLSHKSVEQIRRDVDADSLMFLPDSELDNIGVDCRHCKKCFNNQI